MADASISNLIQTMQDHHNQDERAGKKSNDAQLNALNSLQASFPEEFASACIKLLQNKQLVKKLEYEGIKFVKEKYDWTKINHKLGQLFK